MNLFDMLAASAAPATPAAPAAPAAPVEVAAPKAKAPKAKAPKAKAPKAKAPKAKAVEVVGGLPAAPVHQTQSLDALFEEEDCARSEVAEPVAPLAPKAERFDLESTLKLAAERLYGEDLRDAYLAGLIARVACQHLRVSSLPGNAKSALARLVFDTFGDAHASHQFGAWSGPDSILGPIDTDKLMSENKYARKYERGLFARECAFLDELDKSSDAAAGLVLSALAERRLLDGAVEIETPLQCAIATQNDEIPVEATADRFALAIDLPDIPMTGDFARFMARLSVSPPPPMPAWDRSELERLQRRSKAILRKASDSWFDAFADAIKSITVATGGRLSARRCQALTMCCAAFAALRGAAELTQADLYALRFAAPEPHHTTDTRKTVDRILGRLEGIPSKGTLSALCRGLATAEEVVGDE